MEKTLQDIENEVIDEFSMFDEWLDKYEYLIELGKSLNNYPDSEKTDDKLIKGCQSRVWLDSKVKDGKIFFNADSDAIITKGIISLLIRIYSGRTSEGSRLSPHPVNIRLPAGAHSVLPALV